MPIYSPRWLSHTDKKPERGELDFSNPLNRDATGVFYGTTDLIDGTEATLGGGAQYVENELIIADTVDDYADAGKPHTPSGFGVPFTFLIDFTLTSTGTRNKIYKSNDQGDYYGIWLDPLTDERVAIGYGDGGSPSSNSRRSFDSVESLTVNERTCLAITISGPTTISGFANGVELAFTTSGSGSTLAGHSGHAQIGRLDEGTGWLYAGTSKIRLVAVYGSGRSDDELYALSINPYQILRPTLPSHRFLAEAPPNSLNNNRISAMHFQKHYEPTAIGL